MILVDVNLLLYAVNRDLPGHSTARTWLEQTLSGSERVGFPWIVIMAFLRITTNARVFEKPLTIESAIDYMDDWLNQPVLITVVPGRGHWKILRSLLARTGTGGNLTTDAHIAALALEHGGTVYSTDNDFKRFPGLQHVNPLDD